MSLMSAIKDLQMCLHNSINFRTKVIAIKQENGNLTLWNLPITNHSLLITINSNLTIQIVILHQRSLALFCPIS